MRNLIMIFCWICMYPFAGFSTEPEQLRAKADSLNTLGSYQRAALTYERIVYGAEDNIARTEALLDKAECQLNLGAHEDALASADRIYYFGLTDSLQFRARYHTALYAFLTKDFEQAKSELALLQQFLPDSMSVQASILHALTLNELREWGEAKKLLVHWTNHTYASDTMVRDSVLKDIDAWYVAKKFPKYKNPQKAETMSSIAPGLGQLYTAHFLDAAFNAGMVLTGLGLGAYGIFVLNYYVSGAVVGYAWFQRFYIAGQQRANYLARRYNYRRLRKYNEMLMPALLGLDEI